MASNKNDEINSTPDITDPDDPKRQNYSWPHETRRRDWRQERQPGHFSWQNESNPRDFSWQHEPKHQESFSWQHESGTWYEGWRYKDRTL